MIVLEIDVRRVAVLDFEGHAEVAGDRNRPRSFAISLQLMKPVPRQVHRLKEAGRRSSPSASRPCAQRKRKPSTPSPTPSLHGRPDCLSDAGYAESQKTERISARSRGNGIAEAPGRFGKN